MYHHYFEYFRKRIPLTEEEEAFIASFLTLKKLRKRQYFLQEGDICKAVAFVETGAMRSYRLNDDGTEHIVAFAMNGHFMTDLYSFQTQEPSAYNIDAVEDSELVLITRAASDDLVKQSPKYLEFIFQIVSEAYIQLEKRITSTISLSLE